MAMKSWIPKLAFNEEKKKKKKKTRAEKEDSQMTELQLGRDADCTIPSTPRLERSRNCRRHLTKLQSFQSMPKISYDVRPEPMLPSISEPVSPRRYGSTDSESHSLRPASRHGLSPDGSMSSDTCLSSEGDMECHGAYPENSGFRDNRTTPQTQSVPDALRSSPDNGVSKGIHAIYEGSDERTHYESSVTAPVTPRNRSEEPRKVKGTKGLNIHSSYQSADRARPKDNGHDNVLMHENAQKTPMQSPRSHLSSSRFVSPHRTPMQSPRSSNFTTPRPVVLAWNDESQHAHPLPLPPPSPSGMISPTRNHSRLDDSDRLNPPSPSTGWPRSIVPADGECGQWIKGALLGSGSFGKVYKGIHRETGDFCAIKEVELVADDPRSKESVKQLSQEIMLLSVLRHKNILHYKGSETIGDSLYIYLELVSGGSIYKLLQEFENKIPEPVIRRYTRQILLGLAYLHEKKTVHRDIKCANVLVDQDGVVKLADFGMAKLIGNNAAQLSFKGSPYWMAPEVILQANAGFEVAVDIWSLGCTVIEMATGKPPWYQYEGYAAMFKVINCHDVPIPDTLSPIAQDFIRLCLQRDPAKRPSASTLLFHPFVQLDRFMPSQETSLSESVVERMALKEHAAYGIPRDQAMIQPTLSDAAVGSTTHTKRRAEHVSPRPSFQSSIHSSRLAPLLYNISNSHSVPQNHTPISSKRFTGKHVSNLNMGITPENL